MDTSSAAELFAEGNRLLRQGQTVAAELAFRRTLVLAPDLAEAHANLGWLLARDGRRAEAEACYRQALDLAPSVPGIHLNFAALLLAGKRFREAEAAYQQALLLEPGAPAAWSGLGALLAAQKREDEAENCYRTALGLAPEHRSASFNLAYLLLRQGRYEEGWQRLAAREYFDLGAHLGCPPWQGESLAGKAVFIGIEAGMGDMIQFCRYAALLKARGARQVAILCPPELKVLLAGQTGIDLAVALDEALPGQAWDYWVPLLSLPGLCHTRLDTLPGQLPYLRADAARLAAWRESFAEAGEGMRVGLVWKGNPRFENDADRSLPGLDFLSPLGEVPGVRYFSLQKGAGEEEAGSPPFPITDLGPRLHDFADTAAAIAHLDLVISVDTAVAHLAGALGCPCWLLLPDYKTDWRWGAAGEATPWYPGVMRIFRQAEMGAWAEVVLRVREGLLSMRGG